MTIVLFLLACLAMLAIITAVVRRHIATPAGTSFFGRLSAGFRYSSTLVVARLVALAGAGLELVAQGADLFAAPGLQDAVRGVVPANAWPWVLLGVGLVTELARKRTL